jgi:hypothetical protein
MLGIVPVKARCLDGQREVSTASWLGNQTWDTYECRGSVLGLNLVPKSGDMVTRVTGFRAEGKYTGLCRFLLH